MLINCQASTLKLVFSRFILISKVVVVVVVMETCVNFLKKFSNYQADGWLG